MRVNRVREVVAICFVLSLILSAGIPKNAEALCFDPCCIIPSWIKDGLSWFGKKTIEVGVKTVGAIQDTFIPDKNEKEAYEKLDKQKEKFRKSQKYILESLSNPDNAEKLVGERITPEDFNTFMRTYFPTEGELGDLASYLNKKANQRAAVDIATTVGGYLTKLNPGAEKVWEATVDPLMDARTLYEGLDQLTNDKRGKEVRDFMAQGGMELRRGDLEDFYGKCYNKRWGDETKEIWENQGFDKFENKYKTFRKQGLSTEDAVAKATPRRWEDRWTANLAGFYNGIEYLSGLAKTGLNFLLGLTNPAVKGGEDWDPEWEETWYWEGWDYPQTDINWEEYPYVDEHGAYDWTKG